MKYIIFVILLFSNFQLSAQSWHSKYFRGPVRQEQGNWCVHACLAMTFNFSQCVSVNHWINYSSPGLYPDCCGIPLFTSSENICVSEAEIPRSELGLYLSKNYRPIRGAFTKLENFPWNCEVAFLALRFTSSSHLVTLIEVQKTGDYEYNITYCDPQYGKVQTIPIHGNIEIFY